MSRRDVEQQRVNSSRDDIDRPAALGRYDPKAHEALADRALVSPTDCDRTVEDSAGGKHGEKRPARRRSRCRSRDRQREQGREAEDEQDIE